LLGSVPARVRKKRGGGRRLEREGGREGKTMYNNDPVEGRLEE